MQRLNANEMSNKKKKNSGHEAELQLKICIFAG